MLSLLTLNDSEGNAHVLHEDTSASRRLVKSVTGLVGITPLRDSKRVRPQAHGSINETAYQEGSLIAIDGEVWSIASSGQIEDALEELRAINKVCMETLPTPGFPAYGPALLKWTEGVSGLKLQKAVKLDSDLDPTLQEAAGFIPYHVQFFSEDPRAYSQTLTEATGGTITGSEPEEELIKVTAGIGGAIAIDATYVYYTGGKADCIGRAKLNGSSNEPEWIKGLPYTPTDIAVNSEHIYWVNGETGKVGRAAIAGTSVESTWLSFGGSTGVLNAVAIDSAHIYAATERGTIARATLAGGSPEEAWESIPTTHARGLAVNSEYVYWSWYGTRGSETVGAIGRVEVGGTGIKEEFLTGAGEPGGLAVTATKLLWANESGNAIGRAAIGGTEVNPAFISGASGPRRVAANSEYVYWVNVTTGYVARAPVAGSPAGSSLTISQSGNRPTPVTFKVHGPIKNPSILRTSDGSRIALTGSIASGSYVEINTAERTVKLNGTTSALSMLNAANTNWPMGEAPPSPNTTTYELTATSATNAYMEALYRSAYA